MGYTIDKRGLSAEGAATALAAAKKKAEEIGVPMTIAILDESANLKMLERMDGALLVSVEVAQNKGYTAASTGFSNIDLYEFIKQEPAVENGLPNQPRMAIFGGGVPIIVEGTVVGGVGVSGGDWNQDHEVAAAGAKAVSS